MTFASSHKKKAHLWKNFVTIIPLLIWLLNFKILNLSLTHDV